MDNVLFEGIKDGFQSTRKIDRCQGLVYALLHELVHHISDLVDHY